MTTRPNDPTRPETLAGYDYGSPTLPRSPVTMSELQELRETVGLTGEDARYLQRAGEVLAPRADEIVDAWRESIAAQPHLARYSAHLDGSPNREYGAATKPRFARWIVDACTRPLDQAWLDYQHEIGLRHTRAKKNHTDRADAPDHIPLRYLLAFVAPAILVPRGFLEGTGHGAEEVERMHAAWTKAVVLHVTLWSRAYGGPHE